MKKARRNMMVGTRTLMRTRNVSQSVAYRVVGMTWLISADWYPLHSYRLALRGNIMLGHMTNFKYIIDTIKDDVILLSTRICGFTTHWSWDRELYAYRVFRMGNPGSPHHIPDISPRSCGGLAELCTGFNRNIPKAHTCILIKLICWPS
jgi:hypothetical protein